MEEDQFGQLLTLPNVAGELPDVISSPPLVAVRTLPANDLVDTEATGAVVEAPGADTFDQRTLAFTGDGGTRLQVPSSAWSQLLHYRNDLFAAARLASLTTYGEVAAATRALKQRAVSGRASATATGDAFTQQSFEHVALATAASKWTPKAPSRSAAPCTWHAEVYSDLTHGSGPPGSRTSTGR